MSISALWPSYDFEEAIDKAVIGTVTAKSETKVHEGYDDSNRILIREYYKDVTIEVESVFKGDADMENYDFEDDVDVIKAYLTA